MRQLRPFCHFIRYPYHGPRGVVILSENVMMRNMAANGSFTYQLCISKMG